MLDCQLFGLDPGMHHLTSLVFHVLNASLLFIVFHAMTGAILRSAFVAALFAVHPINVDSVAWIAERKNVLSTFFWMLTMLSYLYYARKPGTRRYFLLLVPFILGLLAKPMLVTLPCVLLLMDFWPLGRLRLFSSRSIHSDSHPKYQPAALLPLIMEKIPLLVLSFFSMGMSMLSLQHGNQTVSSRIVPMMLRMENMAVSHVKYIVKLFWPRDLAVFYPFPDMIPIWQVFGAILVLLAVTVSASLLVRKAPYFIIGWFWFLGTLVPVSGLVQGGRWPEMADRWAYVPAIGIFIIISWGGATLLSKLPYPRIFKPSLAAAAIFMLILTARSQASYWENSQSLFEHATKATSNNYLAHYNLGYAFADEERYEEAMIEYEKAFHLDRDFHPLLLSLGGLYVKMGRIDDAISCFSQALIQDPFDIDVLNGLGDSYLHKGDPERALAWFKKAIAKDPENPVALTNMAAAYFYQQEYDKALSCARSAVIYDPGHADAYYNIALACTKIGDYSHAIENLKKVIELTPDQINAHKKLAELYFSSNQMQNAARMYRKVLEIDPYDHQVHYNLAILLLKENNFDACIRHLQKALELNPDYPQARYALAGIRGMQNNSADPIMDVTSGKHPPLIPPSRGD